MSNSQAFKIAAEKISSDEGHRKTIQFNISRYDAAVSKGMARYKDVVLAKQEAAAIKRDVLQNWDSYLLEFEEKISARGAEVLWAKDTEGHCRRDSGMCRVRTGIAGLLAHPVP